MGGDYGWRSWSVRLTVCVRQGGGGGTAPC
jgi:hypothetical protein